MIGVDLIDIKDIPKFNYQNEKKFFKDNFSKKEIDYIKNSSNQQHIAAVLFSLKESILKCDKFYAGIPFNKINIILKNSSAFHPKFFLSYSNFKNKSILSVALAKNYKIIKIENK